MMVVKKVCHFAGTSDGPIRVTVILGSLMVIVATVLVIGIKVIVMTVLMTGILLIVMTGVLMIGITLPFFRPGNFWPCISSQMQTEKKDAKVLGDLEPLLSIL